MTTTSDDFLSALAQSAKEAGHDAEAILRVLYFESRGLNPSAVSPDHAHFGLNQLSTGWLKDHGIDAKDYITWSALRQLPVVMDFVRYLSTTYNGGLPFTDVNRFYIANFLPGRLYRATSPDAVLTAEPERYYEWNKGLDVDGNGKITVSDIQRRMAGVAAGSQYQALVARLRNLPLAAPPAAGGGAGTAAMVLLGFAVGALLGRAGKG